MYDWLLHLYPRRFRSQFASDMLADFHDGYTVARHLGPLAVMSFMTHSYSDLAVSLISQWRNTESFVVWRAAVSVGLSFWAAALGVAALEWTGGPATLWFAMQIGMALTACSAVTVAIALRNNRDGMRHTPLSLRDVSAREMA